MASVVQSPDGATEGGSRKGPPGSSSFHPNCASPWALSCSCSPTSKNQPQFFVRFNLHLLRTSLAARCRCPLLASTNTPSPPLSRPDRRASPRQLHPLFVLPSVRRGVWCGFVAPDVVALRASNCITAPSSVRQVLLPSCTVISSRAVFFLVSTLNIDRVLGRHPFSPPPLPHLPRALPRWQRLSLPAPRCRSGRSPSERLADHQPHRGPNPSPDPNPPPRPSPRVPTAGAASARHHPLVTRTRPRPRHPHPP